MSEQKREDFYSKIKWHAFQIFLLILFLYTIYEFLKWKIPGFPWIF